MERLTEKRESGAWPKKDWTYEAIAECLDRLAAIEDILGHVLEIWEDPFAVDPDSGLYHLQHIATNISFLLKMRREGKAREKSYFVVSTPVTSRNPLR